MRRLISSLRVSAAPLALLVAAGCGGASTPAETLSSSQPNRAQELRGILSQAKGAGVDKSQIEILERGEMSFGDYQAAMERTFTCVRLAGIEIDGPTLSQYLGIPLFRYGYASTSEGRSEEETGAITDDCDTKYSTFVALAYRTGPSAVEASDRLLEKYRPAILDCLAANGAKIESEASAGALRSAMDKMIAEKPADPEADCYLQTGYLVPDGVGPG